MLHGREDHYALPELAQKLYDKCPAKNKRLVFFEKGDHSRLWVNAPERYEAVVGEFIDEVYPNNLSYNGGNEE